MPRKSFVILSSSPTPFSFHCSPRSSFLSSSFSLFSSCAVYLSLLFLVFFLSLSLDTSGVVSHFSDFSVSRRMQKSSKQKEYIHEKFQLRNFAFVSSSLLQEHKRRSHENKKHKTLFWSTSQFHVSMSSFSPDSPYPLKSSCSNYNGVILDNYVSIQGPPASKSRVFSFTNLSRSTIGRRRRNSFGASPSASWVQMNYKNYDEDTTGDDMNLKDSTSSSSSPFPFSSNKRKDEKKEMIDDLVELSTSTTSKTSSQLVEIQEEGGEVEEARKGLVGKEVDPKSSSSSSIPLIESSKNREKEINLYINAGFIAFVSFFVVAKLLTVDFDNWRGWTLEEIFLRIPVDNWGHYMGTLEEKPILTKAFTSFTVYFLGDSIAQLAEGKEIAEIDRIRVGRSAIAGLIGHGPLSHFWYEACEYFFNDVIHWTAWWSFIPKITVDQLVWGPTWNGMYILILGLLKRESLGLCFQNIRQSTIPLLVSGLKLWPMAHVLTYGVIPIENRLLWVDMVEILWVTILSQQAKISSDASDAAGSVDESESESELEIDGGR